ncbi:MAG: BrnT family toxin [bacterium]|nr:BrnT family toxin [bacterium]
MRFTWDEKKRQATRTARGLDFADSEFVFAGPTFTWEDTRCRYGEQRWITLGLLFETIVVLVHTETDDEIRVISMRRASKDEQATYFTNSGLC